MVAFARYLSSSALVLSAFLGCHQDLEPIDEVTSLRIEMLMPTDPGSIDMRLGDADRDLLVNIYAIDAAGEVASDFSGDIDLFGYYLGGLSPQDNNLPLERLPMVNGALENVSISLPNAFGPSFLWAEHKTGDDPTFATGTSAKLWFRNPYLQDVSTPDDEVGLGAYETSPLEEKSVSIDASRHGETGRMVVTGVYAQGYTVSDVNCSDADATPPCTTGNYDHMFVYTFSRPEDENGNLLQVGQQIEIISGAVSEFNGLTEIGFPTTFIGDLPINENILPTPEPADASWFGANQIEFERYESGLISVANSTVCPLDAAYEQYGQWKLNLGAGCGDDSISVLTTGQVTGFDPETYVGQTLAQVVGTMRPVNIGSFNVWIMYPRTMADLVVM